MEGNLVDSCKLVSNLTTLVLVHVNSIDFQSILSQNLAFERNIIVISNKRVLSWFIDGWNKIPSHFAYTFKVINLIWFTVFYFFVVYIFCHLTKRFLDIVHIRRKMLEWPVKWYGTEVPIPCILFYSLIYIIWQLHIEGFLQIFIWVIVRNTLTSWFGCSLESWCLMFNTLFCLWGFFSIHLTGRLICICILYLWYRTDEALEEIDKLLEPDLLGRAYLPLIMLQSMSMSILEGIWAIEK